MPWNYLLNLALLLIVLNCSALKAANDLKIYGFNSNDLTIAKPKPNSLVENFPKECLDNTSTYTIEVGEVIDIQEYGFKYSIMDLSCTDSRTLEDKFKNAEKLINNLKLNTVDKSKGFALKQISSESKQGVSLFSCPGRKDTKKFKVLMAPSNEYNYDCSTLNKCLSKFKDIANEVEIPSFRKAQEGLACGKLEGIETMNKNKGKISNCEREASANPKLKVQRSFGDYGNKIGLGDIEIDLEENDYKIDLSNEVISKEIVSKYADKINSQISKMKVSCNVVNRLIYKDDNVYCEIKLKDFNRTAKDKMSVSVIYYVFVDKVPTTNATKFQASCEYYTSCIEKNVNYDTKDFIVEFRSELCEKFNTKDEVNLTIPKSFGPELTTPDNSSISNSSRKYFKEISDDSDKGTSTSSSGIPK